MRYCREAEVERSAPTLFDLADLEAPANGNGKNGHSAAGYRDAFAAEIDADLAYLPS